MPTKQRPLELDDADRFTDAIRADAAILTPDDFRARWEPLQGQYTRICEERRAAEWRAEIAIQEARIAIEAERARRVTRLAYSWVLVCLSFAVLAWYLGRVGL